MTTKRLPFLVYVLVVETGDPLLRTLSPKSSRGGAGVTNGDLASGVVPFSSLARSKAPGNIVTIPRIRQRFTPNTTFSFNLPTRISSPFAGNTVRTMRMIDGIPRTMGTLVYRICQHLITVLLRPTTYTSPYPEPNDGKDQRFALLLSRT